MEHEPGDKTYIDFAGKKLSYFDREIGEDVPVEVMVTCLGYSQMIYAEGLKDVLCRIPTGKKSLFQYE